jgi:hypothetical protein
MSESEGLSLRQIAVAEAQGLCNKFINGKERRA